MKTLNSELRTRDYELKMYESRVDSSESTLNSELRTRDYELKMYESRVNSSESIVMTTLNSELTTMNLNVWQ